MRKDPFADLAPTPVVHFKLYFYAAILQLIEYGSRVFGSREDLFNVFPFLNGYYQELAARGIADLPLAEAAKAWEQALHEWEQKATELLPLCALAEAAGLNYGALLLLLSIGLIEEDARFGLLYEVIQGTPGQHRPTVGLFNGWWESATNRDEIRASLWRLRELGLVQVVNADAPRTEWAFQIPGLLWDVLVGNARPELSAWALYRPMMRLAAYHQLIVPEQLKPTLQSLPGLLRSGEVQTIIVRGLQHNGRRTLLSAIARGLGRGSLIITGLNKADDERWALVGPLATLLRAMPVIVLNPAPGETAQLPQLHVYDGPLGIVIGKHGGVSGPPAERAITLTIDLPDLNARHQHWRQIAGIETTEELAAISERFRMTSGNIRRTARLAQSYAKLAARPTISLADVQQASRTLNRQALDTLTTHLPALGDWSYLAADAETLAELRSLEGRCRHRERLHDSASIALGAQMNAGVRALFTGPSGTGKTLAARILASVLEMDLYRLDLSSVVNKYIGETEKNLNEILARAEELDVILLLDEGDALLTQRTNVQTSNDRYANLETNFLLQRLESFEGILVVTTNAQNRIDGAFQRRMDVVIEFHAPEVAERWAIWQLHLPPTHTVETPLLREVVGRCTLTGGQIRNAVLHASLLALDDGGSITSAHLETAVQREYRKLGAVCPLRRAAVRA